MSDAEIICPVCKKEGAHLCSACKLVSYCSKEHQKEHWPTHKAQCQPFNMKHSSDLGRYLACSRDLKRDATVISEHPLAFGPKIVGPAAQCLGCYQPLEDPNDPKVARCPRCRWPICSNVCFGVIHKDHHQPECLVLCNNVLVAENNNFMYEAIFPLRCLLLQKKNPRKWQQFMSLESHVNERQNDVEINGEVEKIAKYLCDNFLDQLEKGALPDMSRKLIHFICGVIETNSLEITTGRGEVHAIYPTASLMEHNCIFNTKHYFQLDDFKINVLAATDIKKGDNLSTMYTHILWGTQARRDHLKATKYFLCKCQRCSDPTELGTHLSSLKCVGADAKDETVQCQGTILPISSAENADWKCDRCPATLTASHVADLMSRISSDVDLHIENPTVPKLEQFLSKLDKLLHKNHYHCFMVKHSLIQLYGRESGFTLDKLTDLQLARKIDMCKELMCTIDVIDPGHGRAVLYSAVVQLELQSALEESSRRAQAIADKNRLLAEAKVQLEACIRDLAQEPPFSAGASVAGIAKSRLIELLREIKKLKTVES
ncbi:Set and mynd domain containing [Nesidiocoris tenuis]|uniref:Set and mynd domain containing n=1 Tax=Nesidiocoris tenuis TaxID=355587 RepID=A0ABN7A6W5_9HEMI|nr:Set and mynd domain containing [Nesidiocoris tenuis]